MSTRRKTIKRDLIIDKTNQALRSDHSTIEQRKAIATMLEIILMASDDYRGFTYQASEFSDDLNNAEWPLRKGYDDTRRVYF